MSLVELLVFIFGCTGITVLVVFSSILEPIRDFISSRSEYLEKLLSCTMCSGFWVGLLISCFYDINPIMGASISSLFSWGASSVVESFNTLSVFLETYLEDGEETDERIVE